MRNLRERFGGGNLVPAGVLGHVHAGIGHANQVLERKSVDGETGHAEAAGDLVFFEHGIGCQPEPQSLGQDLRLLDPGFGHEDDEFVSAVTGDHVGLALFCSSSRPRPASAT